VKKILTPSSRLIIVFILTLVISGGILTYLSINSISNFNQLTEKKVREEQDSLAAQVAYGFQQRLKRITGIYATKAMSNPRTAWDSLLGTGELEHIEHPFILDAKGRFFRPLVVDPVPGMEPSSSPTYRKYKEAGQQYEFRENNLPAAIQDYMTSLEYAAGEVDSASSLNAIARVYLKMEAYDKSFRYYSRVTGDYAHLLDQNGFPYVYYALLNMIRCNQSDTAIDASPQVTRFLEGILEGIVPVNQSTTELLDRIIAWKARATIDPPVTADLVPLIGLVRQNLVFLDEWADRIIGRVQDWTEGVYQAQPGGFLVVDDAFADPFRVIVIGVHEGLMPGFSIRVDSLWRALSSSSTPFHTEFDYKITLQQFPANGQRLSGKLVTGAQLAPYLSRFEIQVRLRDEHMIDQFIKRRKWSYGIALVLLLGAMSMGIFLILKDITREKHTGRMRSDFVSNVTHELKTPLTSIHLFAESVMLDRVETEAEKKEYLRIILRETERLKRMINNILDFSRKEKGMVDYRMEKVDLTSLVRSALEDLGYWLEELHFTVHLDLEEGACTRGDPDALKQVVINLLDNAIKYSSGQKVINITMASEGDSIKIEFADKGIGIPEDQLDAIFDKFYRAQQDGMGGIGGTGLGLTVVREIIEAHRGKVSVSSKINKGSTFTLFLKSV